MVCNGAQIYRQMLGGEIDGFVMLWDVVYAVLKCVRITVAVLHRPIYVCSD